MRPIWAEINLKNAIGNSKEIRKFVGNDVMIMAIVKANGYGHGALPISLEIEEQVDMFGAAIMDEAHQLREGGIKKPILVLGYTRFVDYAVLVKNEIMQTIYSKKQAEELNKVAISLNKVAKVHIKIDTGMNRLGFGDGDATLDIIKAIDNMSNIHIDGIFSHIANGGSSDLSYSVYQIDRFKRFVEKAEQAIGRKVIKHLANSATLVEFKEAHFDMVRPGLMLYGSTSTEHENIKKMNLKKVLTLKGIITQIKVIDIGEPVSYNGTFVTTRKTKIGVLPIGYADGFARSLSNRGQVLVNGVKVPLIGNVCMDQVMLDLTDIADIEVPQEVIIYGEDNPVEYFADLLDTINYEIYCNLSERIPRIYLEG
ncbi:MAG: alanine racemase [Firmicutes bacterium]|nr:alanine racemase [Bacillota bacterium]